MMLSALAAVALGASCVTTPSDAPDAPDVPSSEGCLGIEDPAFAKSLEASWRVAPHRLASPLKSPKDERGRVLVVTLNGDGRVDDKVGEEVQLTKQLWVTLAPELQMACARSRIEGISDRDRLHQLVGVPSAKAYDRVTAYWVDPTGLFRPCEDPEVDDNTCQSPSDAWLLAQSGTPRCYPFTGVGYTWDWLAEAPGLSEFQLFTSDERKERGDTDVTATVHCIYKDLAAFCDEDRPPASCGEGAAKAVTAPAQTAE